MGVFKDGCRAIQPIPGRSWYDETRLYGNRKWRSRTTGSDDPSVLNYQIRGGMTYTLCLPWRVSLASASYERNFTLPVCEYITIGLCFLVNALFNLTISHYVESYFSYITRWGTCTDGIHLNPMMVNCLIAKTQECDANLSGEFTSKLGSGDTFWSHGVVLDEVINGRPIDLTLSSVIYGL